MPRELLSYAHGPSAIPLIGETIGVHFDRTVERWGDRLGLVVSQQAIRWTYRELGAKVDACAAGLLALGLEPGERIGIWSPNNAEWVISQFATAKAGLVLVNINPAYRLSELEYALNKVGCRALITAERFKSSDYVGMIGTLVAGLRWSICCWMVSASRLRSAVLAAKLAAKNFANSSCCAGDRCGFAVC